MTNANRIREWQVSWSMGAAYYFLVVWWETSSCITCNCVQSIPSLPSYVWWEERVDCTQQLVVSDDGWENVQRIPERRNKTDEKRHPQMIGESFHTSRCEWLKALNKSWCPKTRTCSRRTSTPLKYYSMSNIGRIELVLGQTSIRLIIITILIIVVIIIIIVVVVAHFIF